MHDSFNMDKKRNMRQLKKQANAGEDVFKDISDEYLTTFIIQLALESADDAVMYRKRRQALLELSRDEQIDACRDYYLKHETISNTYYVIKSTNPVGQRKYLRNSYPNKHDYTHANKLSLARRFETRGDAEAFIAAFKDSKWEIKDPEILEIEQTLAIKTKGE